MRKRLADAPRHSREILSDDPALDSTCTALGSVESESETFLGACKPPSYGTLETWDNEWVMELLSAIRKDDNSSPRLKVS